MGQIGAWLSNSAAAFFLPGEGRRRDRHISWAIRGEKRHVPILHPKPLLSPRALSWRKGEPEGLRAHEHYSALQLQRLWPCTAPPQPAAPLGNLSGRNQCCVQSNLDHFISHVSEACKGGLYLWFSRSVVLHSGTPCTIAHPGFAGPSLSPRICSHLWPLSW